VTCSPSPRPGAECHHPSKVEGAWGLFALSLDAIPNVRRFGPDGRHRLVRFLSVHTDRRGPPETYRTRGTAATIPLQLSLTIAVHCGTEFASRRSPVRSRYAPHEKGPQTRLFLFSKLIPKSIKAELAPFRGSRGGPSHSTGSTAKALAGIVLLLA
jgi:hypothetical protein